MTLTREEWEIHWKEKERLREEFWRLALAGELVFPKSVCRWPVEEALLLHLREPKVWTFAALARKYGVSRTRVSSAFFRLASRYAGDPDLFRGSACLSPRARNCLKNEFGADFTPDMVAGQTEDELLRMTNFGRKSLLEVRAWLQRHGTDCLSPKPKRPDPLEEISNADVEVIARLIKEHGFSLILRALYAVRKRLEV
jgi:hypothetical protein